MLTPKAMGLAHLPDGGEKLAGRRMASQVAHEPVLRIRLAEDVREARISRHAIKRAVTETVIALRSAMAGTARSDVAQQLVLHERWPHIGLFVHGPSPPFLLK
ncbi:MAG TPA: hypothetical protein VLE46_13375 [Nitrospira sp.]|nr:hypothetical protein [Nitrospira sp.]